MSKCKTHANIFTCEEPLFKLPPTDAAAQYNCSHFGNGDVEHHRPEKRHRHAFMVCSLLPALNAATTFFKKHHCGKTANCEEVWNHFTHWEEKGNAGEGGGGSDNYEGDGESERRLRRQAPLEYFLQVRDSRHDTIFPPGFVDTCWRLLFFFLRLA